MTSQTTQFSLSLTDADRTDTTLNVHRTILDLFYEQVRTFPDKKALTYLEESYTYEELNELSNGIAAALLDRGIKKGDFAGVYIKRSADAVLAMLGALKAGAVYVPIDPAYPADRIQYMIEDTNCRVILVNQSVEEPGLDKLSVNMKTIKPLKEPIQTMNISPQDLAYIIYTSGSTGKPKGTMIRHAGVHNLAKWLASHYQFHENTVISEFASFSFDASIIDIFQALLNGARLHIFSEESRTNYSGLLDEIEQHRVTNMILPTAYFNNMVSALGPDDVKKLDSVEVIALAGEALTGEPVRLWQGLFGMKPMISNFYGPSEATVMASYYDIDEPLDKEVANVPIGRPIGGVQLYVVNGTGEQCLDGEPGELLIEGPGISAGYLNQPEKTDAVFCSYNGRMYYRSGDIVRKLPDGNIEFLGRTDDQVKIRGHRIEIGEIENALIALGYIQEAAVIPKANAAGKELYCFYTVKEGMHVPKEVLNADLKKRLPEYMVPSFYIELSEMPIAATGKIDRKYLENEDIHRFLSGRITPPQTETEVKIADAAAAELTMAELDRHDDLFTIGANSFKVLSILAKLKPDFPQLNLQHFYTHRTVARLGEFLDQSQEDEAGRQIRKQVKLTEHPLFIGDNQNKEGISQDRHILLTGATGFLGAHVLMDLLKEPDVHVYCLVRGNSEAEAEMRLQKVLDPFQNEFTDKTKQSVLLGDLGKDRLGLQEDVYEELKHTLTHIIHCAAEVRHYGDPEHFYHINVRGTQELLDLCKDSRHIHFSYVSTMGIPEDLAVENLWESYCSANPSQFVGKLANVYTSSKFEAEKRIHMEMEKGLKAAVFRAGNLTGRSDTGVFQENIESNAFYRMVKGLMMLEKMEETDSLVDFTPVDLASRAVTELTFDPEAAGRTFHIIDPNPMSFADFLDCLNKAGYEIDTVSHEQFMERVYGVELDAEGRQLAISIQEGEGLKDPLMEWDCCQTLAFLPSYEDQFERKEEYVKKLVSYGQECGYFPVPKVLV
ncbi:amino acid adenylation domain-containing protein [Bacillus sp. FJAT-42376]|uniref:amino acid adenylation domain-containing protein n=1 Tax=Bacillus sp. FJAT-42376 TaxID=2014076 RepID=UPI000F4DBACD|nr:amino acid adenylation domain-containing protein [Bacillus sp. FJAT-42376]AZB42083.1 amino acid adenylation domain-containing protein [Bacillus sp. FJAT-42376]